MAVLCALSFPSPPSQTHQLSLTSDCPFSFLPVSFSIFVLFSFFVLVAHLLPHSLSFDPFHAHFRPSSSTSLLSTLSLPLISFPRPLFRFFSPLVRDTSVRGLSASATTLSVVVGGARQPPYHCQCRVASGGDGAKCLQCREEARAVRRCWCRRVRPWMAWRRSDL